MDKNHKWSEQPDASPLFSKYMNTCKKVLEKLCLHTHMETLIIHRKINEKLSFWYRYDALVHKLTIGSDEDYNICNNIQYERDPIVIEDAESCENLGWKNLLLHNNIRSYISYPFTDKDGGELGYLFFINTNPMFRDKSISSDMLNFCCDLIAINFTSIWDIPDSI